MSHSYEEVIIPEEADCEEQIRLNRDDESGGGCIINMENEKRMRREIANSNERRRMQSINAGFQSLRSLLPHHEGEKLSKAAILQQTAQYIIELEREKTHLLSQNCQLKRLVDQQDGGETHVLKKRKLDNVFTIQTISDSSDEGLGSMSPEPITLLTSAGGKTTAAISTATPKEIVELKNLLEVERRQKAALEERLRQIELQIYPDRCRDVVSLGYQHQEVIEHTDNVREEEVLSEPITKLHGYDSVQVVSIESLPAVGQTQVVVCTNDEDDMVDEDSRTATPVEIEYEHDVKQEIVISEPCRVDSPEPVQIRLQPILEAAIKAEPKVEVERIHSPVSVTVLKDESSAKTNSPSSSNAKKGSRSRMFIRHNTSRQNLETIVEAIRHLEGDQLFGEIVEPTQEVPLALTNKPQRQLQIEMNPFLQFRSGQQSPSAAPTQATSIAIATAAITNTIRPSPATVSATPVTAQLSTPVTVVTHLQQQQQCRPGVIVVKQSS